MTWTLKNINHSEILILQKKEIKFELTRDGWVQIVDLPWKLAISKARGQEVGDHSINCTESRGESAECEIHLIENVKNVLKFWIRKIKCIWGKIIKINLFFIFPEIMVFYRQWYLSYSIVLNKLNFLPSSLLVRLCK